MNKSVLPDILLTLFCLLLISATSDSWIPTIAVLAIILVGSFVYLLGYMFHKEEPHERKQSKEVA